MTRSGRKAEQPEQEFTKRSAVQKLDRILAVGPALTEEITLSALRLVPLRSPPG